MPPPSAGSGRTADPEASTDREGATDPGPPVGTARPRETPPLWGYALRIVGLFVVVGAGLGLANNFVLGFLIEQFVDPGGNPTDNTLVGIMLVNAIVTPVVLGPLIAAGASLALGRALPDRRLAATAVGAGVSVVGFYLMAFVALFLTVVVLAQYGGGGGGAGGGGSGGPFDPMALVSLILEAGIPAAIVGTVAAYIGTRL